MMVLRGVCCVLLLWTLFGAALAQPNPPQQCRPCTTEDGPQCTHPGNANQQWCDANCPDGVNDAGCPASHCFCGTMAVPRRCRPCTAEERWLGCTHPNVASQAFCDAICPNQVNDDVCVISHCYCSDEPIGQQEDEGESPGAESPESPGAESPESPGAESPESPGAESPESPGAESPQFPAEAPPQRRCRPCRITDGAQCTHPGNADQQWCDSNCPNGVNGAGCPASHCFCGTSVQRHCRPCTADDPGCLFPGVADLSWCDAHCPRQENDGVCLASFCFCDPNQIFTSDNFKTFGRSMRVSSENTKAFESVRDLGETLYRTHNDPSVNVNFATGIVVAAIAAVIVFVVLVASLWRHRIVAPRVSSCPVAYHGKHASSPRPERSEGDFP